MAVIRDELILADRFSNALRDYADGLAAAARATRASNGNMVSTTNMAATQRLQTYQSMMSGIQREMLRMDVVNAAHVRQSNALAAAGKQESETFKQLDSAMERAGQKYRELGEQKKVLKQAIETVITAYRQEQAAAEQAAQAQMAAAAKTAVQTAQSMASNTLSAVPQSAAGAQNAMQSYAQAVINARQQTDQYRLSLQMESQMLQIVIDKYGAGSAAAMEQAQAVKRAADAVNQGEMRARAYQGALEQAAGGARQAAQAVDQYRNSVNSANTSTSGLMNSVRNLAGAFLGLQGMKNGMGLSDSMVQTRARLDILTGGEGTDELQQMIFQSAQRSRGDYMNTADMVSKMGIMAGDAFQGPQELVAFTEMLNKMYTVSGTNTAGQRAATLQLQQAMAMGTLRGQEFRSVVQQVPMLVQAIGDSLGVSTGEVKKMADEGLITAAVVKNAMFSAADSVNEKFSTMPMTWSQVWTSMKNTALMATQPLLEGVNWLANNIEIIGPIVLGVAAAVGVYALAILAKNAVETVGNGLAAISAARSALKAGMSLKEAAAIKLASGAQVGFNTALLASPITWVVGGIILLIAILYAGVGAFNKLTGASVSALGIIAGAFFALGAQVLNMTIVPVQNGFANFANFLGNLFNDPVAAVQILFYDMADTVLGYVSTVAHGMEDLINKIPGMEVNLTSGIDNLRAKVQKASQDVKDASGWTEYVKKIDYFDLTESFKYGYEKGSSFNPLGDLAGMGEELDISSMVDELGAINKNTGQTAKNTADFADEDFKYLEDVAIRRYEAHINSTSLVPQITVQVDGRADRETAEDIAGRIAAILRREAASATSLTFAEV